MSVLKIRDENRKFIPIKSIKGESAYEQAKAGGYLGTEEEFIRALASLGGEYALQTINDGYDEHIDDKNNPHKVTAEQVGALPLTGGIMKGKIEWNDGKTHVVGQGDGNFIVRNYKTSEEGNDDFLAFHNTLPLNNVLRIYRNGVPYSIYGQHNKPTAEDVGALSNTGGTVEGTIVIDSPEGWGQIVMHSLAGNYRCVEADDIKIRLDARNTTNSSDRRCLDIFSKAGKDDLSNAIRLSETVGGAETVYPILHTGNINDFAISKGSYSGDNATSKTIPIRKTTQMVIVYGTSGGGDAYTLGILVRGMAKAHCNIGPTDYTNCLNVEWGDTTVKYSYENAAALYSWNAVGATYNYILVG